ncbi:MAG: serine O-acetyltransferase [Clostridia bacterium]|nr:serine O-acetyltransferase [Clostridia bacterium]
MKIEEKEIRSVAAEVGKTAKEAAGRAKAFADEHAPEARRAAKELADRAARLARRAEPRLNAAVNGAVRLAKAAKNADAETLKQSAAAAREAARRAAKTAEDKAKAACGKTKTALEQIRGDIRAFRERDPAASSDLEVALLYSGFHALLAHRAAHALHERGFTFSARALSQTAKFFTGIEIHPAAKIGRGLVIDHGSGVVIGETAEIGDNCTIYQGVTLGGTGKDTGKRHPTLGNNVMVGAGAKVLGPFTVGDNSKIAAGAVVLKEVPPDSTCVGIPAKVVAVANRRVEESDLDQIHIPDPVAAEIARLEERLARLEAAAGEKTGAPAGEDLKNKEE